MYWVSGMLMTTSSSFTTPGLSKFEADRLLLSCGLAATVDMPAAIFCLLQSLSLCTADVIPSIAGVLDRMPHLKSESTGATTNWLIFSPPVTDSVKITLLALTPCLSRVKRYNMTPLEESSPLPDTHMF